MFKFLIISCAGKIATQRHYTKCDAKILLFIQKPFKFLIKNINTAMMRFRLVLASKFSGTKP